jgi:uncharacterized membrane-anchored protein YjiN (DUF445 family)
MTTRQARRRNPWGTFFLVFSAAGFLLFTFGPWGSGDSVRFPRAFFEASLVGALADWFAVTALFKGPLGLPLPHTDLLVRRKDQLVQALPRFLGTFLEPSAIHPVLETFDWAGLLVDKVEPAALDGWAAEGLGPLLEPGPVRDTWETKAIDLALTVLHRELARHREALVGPVTEIIRKNAGWKGIFVGRDTVDEAVAGFLDELEAVRDQPDHQLRRYLSTAVRDALPRLADQVKPSAWAAGTWKRLQSDPEFRKFFNLRAGVIAAALWDRTGAASALTGALEYLLARTDARSLASRIEAAVAHDLQYIRVNGAVVGGVAGVVLEALKGLVL